MPFAKKFCEHFSYIQTLQKATILVADYSKKDKPFFAAESL